MFALFTLMYHCLLLKIITTVLSLHFLIHVVWRTEHQRQKHPSLLFWFSHYIVDSWLGTVESVACKHFSQHQMILHVNTNHIIDMDFLFERLHSQCLLVLPIFSPYLELELWQIHISFWDLQTRWLHNRLFPFLSVCCIISNHEILVFLCQLNHKFKYQQLTKVSSNGPLVIHFKLINS